MVRLPCPEAVSGGAYSENIELSQQASAMLFHRSAWLGCLHFYICTCKFVGELAQMNILDRFGIIQGNRAAFDMIQL